MTIKVTYNVTDVYVTQDVSPVYINVSYSTSSSGGSVWGGITGTLSNQTDLQNALNAKVPYSGATTNVNLGEYEIKAGQLTLDTSPTGTAAVGTTRWNDTIGSSETTLKGGSVILKNGVDLVARVVNKVSPNTTLTKAAYQAVRVSGAQGQRLAVAFAQANNDNNSADTIGLVIETIATNQEGFIMTVGQIEGINTTGSLQGETWNDGDIIYLSPTIAGAVTNVKPSGGQHLVIIGYVEYAHAVNGRLYIKISNGWEITELHDVDVTSPANNEALIYESATALWKNKSIATALGYTPANAATTLTINGVTYDLSANRSWSFGTITGSGASGQVSYWDGTTSQAGSNDFQWNGTNLLLGNDKGLVLQTAGTNRNVLLRPTVILDNYAGLSMYPNSGTNVGFSLSIIPRGTGYNSQIKSQITVFNTDYTADSTNYELGVFRAAGDRFSFSTGAAGTGTNKPFLLSSGYADGATNPNHLWLYTSGNVGINTSSDGGQRLQVQGTTLLNGNVTFSSATGMFWDATNSRLGIGTNAPAYDLHILKASAANGEIGFQVRNTTTTGGAFSSFSNNLDERLVLEMFGSSWGGGGLASKGTLSSSGSNGLAHLVFSNSSTAHFSIHTTTSVTERFRLFGNTGNVLIQNGGTFTDSGERLQVTGTMKVTGASSFGGNMSLALNQNLDTYLSITNTTSGTSSQSYITLISDTNSGQFVFGKYSTAKTAYKTINSKDSYIYNNTVGGDISLLNDFASGNIKFAAGGSSTAHFTIKSNGRINMSSLPTSSTGLATGDLWNNAGVINIV